MHASLQRSRAFHAAIRTTGQLPLERHSVCIRCVIHRIFSLRRRSFLKLYLLLKPKSKSAHCFVNLVDPQVLCASSSTWPSCQHLRPHTATTTTSSSIDDNPAIPPPIPPPSQSHHCNSMTATTTHRSTHACATMHRCFHYHPHTRCTTAIPNHISTTTFVTTATIIVCTHDRQVPRPLGLNRGQCGGWSGH